MIARSLLISPFFAALSYAAPVKSGHATAEWISGATSIEGGKPFLTGIRMVIEDGWHSYWTNPGESGMKLKVVWDLPAGWTAGEVQHPAPIKFHTGELPGYGYEGEVIFPVTLTPPAGASEGVQLSAKLSWLTCNDASCIPGKAEVKLTPGAGSTKSAAAIEKAKSLVPKPLSGLKLEVSESADGVKLSLGTPGGFDPSSWQIFPATEMALDHYKAIEFRKEGEKWEAKTSKNAYADGPLKELVLVLVKEGESPLEVAWQAK
jgi:DsbC/DsbD-like thiol-disulfide interchange protein